MWKTFQHNDNLYMLKIVKNVDGLNIYLTDLESLWVQEISNENLFELFQQYNPLIQIKIEDVESEVLNVVENVSNSKTVDISDDGIKLTVKYEKSGFGIQFLFDLSKSTSEMFLREITVPLIQTVKHLEDCKEILLNLVQKKERELEEYKLEKGIISREDLRTEKFDENVLNTIDDKSMIGVFNQSKLFWESFSNKYGKIEAKIEDVKKDPWNHIKHKRKVYSSSTVVKKGKGINYGK